jgi:hypothetical protein
MTIDDTKAHIILEDGSIWQVLDETGEYDEAATQAAIKVHLENTDAGSYLH